MPNLTLGNAAVTMTLTKPPRSARKAKGDGHLRRAEILHAAELIFVRDGYQGATIRKIAEEVGVSSTALYMHFRDKDEILLEICEGAISTLLASNNEISARPIDAVSRVRLMLDAYMRFGLENPNTYRLAFCSNQVEISAMRREVAADLGARCYDRFMRTVADIAAEGRLRVGDADSAAQTLWAACHGLVSLRINQHKSDKADGEVLIALMLDSLFQGLVID
jgi:AcrR family transcriptional regulator